MTNEGMVEMICSSLDTDLDGQLSKEEMKGLIVRLYALTIMIKILMIIIIMIQNDSLGALKVPCAPT